MGIAGMAINFMDLLGSMAMGGMSSSSNSRMQSAGSGIQDMLSSLLGGGQSVLGSAGRAMGGTDNLAAAGIGALLGALTGSKQSSTTMNGLGGGMMGLLGMMAYKALRGSGQETAKSAAAYTPPTPAQAASDAEIILTAMIDAAKADGQVDADELNRITGRIQSTGIGQEGMNYIIAQLQAPMATDKIIAATRGKPELAAEVYSASLMSIDVDTSAERNYLDRLARGMGLSQQVVNNIERIVGMQKG